MTQAQVRLVAWTEAEFIRRTFVVRRGGAPLDWVGSSDRVLFSEVEALAAQIGSDEVGDDLRQWITSMRNWSRWFEAINHMDAQALERSSERGPQQQSSAGGMVCWQSPA